MAKRKQPRRQGGNGTPLWAWLLVGLFVGALLYFAYRQIQTMNAEPTDMPIPGSSAAHDKQGSEPASEPAASSEQDGVLDTDYSFYDVLPTEENPDLPTEDGQPAGEGSDQSAADSAAAPADSPSAPETKPAADNARYLLQAGSFERAADADDLKARIALSGEAARVESAVVNGKTMHRVRLGPYADIKAANAAKANLAGQGIETVSIQIK